MSHVHAFANHYDVSRRAAAQLDPIEWEELPSLAASLNQRLMAVGSRHVHAARATGADSQAGIFDGWPYTGAVWTETMPASLDALAPSEPFRETLSGLATREVNEPDVFRHFFGPAPR